MVNLDSRLAEIKKMIDRGDYFTINRGRQYGKTTTLAALENHLKDNYIVVSMDFQKQMSNAKFRDEAVFSRVFAKALIRELRNMKFNDSAIHAIEIFNSEIGEDFELVELFEAISCLCTGFEKPIVLIIDEVDSASNNQVFLDFLAQLLGYYLDRQNSPTFQSVILAGVHDIRHLKQKIRPNEEHKLNSPWKYCC